MSGANKTNVWERIGWKGQIAAIASAFGIGMAMMGFGLADGANVASRIMGVAGVVIAFAGLVGSFVNLLEAK